MDLKKALAELKDKHVTLVAFGDSITENNNWTLGGRNWVQHLECHINSIFPHRTTVINSGVGGDSLPACFDRLDRDVLRFQPDIVIVSFGTNDCINEDPEGFRTMYRNLLNKIRNAGALVITRTPTPWLNMETGQQLTHRHNGKIIDLERYVSVIKEVSAELDIYCIDHYAYWMKSLKSMYHTEMVMLMGNSVHPNANGHRRLYYEIAPHFGLPQFAQGDFEHILWRDGDYQI